MSKKILTNDLLNLKPKNSTSKHFIELKFPNIEVSQCEYSEGPVGLTFIKAKKGMKVYMKARGGWPGYLIKHKILQCKILCFTRAVLKQN